MNRPLTPHAVVENLQDLSRSLAELITKLDEAERDAVNRREDYTLALSKAFLSADGPMDIRKHESIRLTHNERLEAELAEATVRGLRRQVDSVRVRIDVGRSLGVVVRQEMNLAGIESAA